MTASPPRILPTTVKVAAALLITYGVVVFINATWGQVASDWQHRAEYPRP